MESAFEDIATIVYADGATIKTRKYIYGNEQGVELVISRSGSEPDASYMLTTIQANEVIYAISKALMKIAVEDENAHSGRINN